jgi:hypothetical protein
LSTARLRSLLVRYRFFLLLGGALFAATGFDFVVAAFAPLIGGAAAFFVATAGM